MRVEIAGPGDVDALVGLRLDYLREDHGPLDDGMEQSIRENLPGYFRAHLGGDLRAFVAREGGEIAACAFLLVVEKPMSPAFPNGRTGTVLNVYTRPPFRRRGYAGRVMRALMDAAGEMDLSVVELKSTEAGRALYRSLGFRDDSSKYCPMKWVNPCTGPSASGTIPPNTTR